MIRFVPVLLLGFVCYLVFVQALQCGIAQQMGEENLQNALRKCMGSKSSEPEEKQDKSASDSESSEEKAATYSASRGMLASRIRRTAFNEKTIKRDVNSTSEHEHEEEKEEQSSQNGNESKVDNRCILQCIFNELGMVDSNGYPEHHLVAASLLKNAKGRELRDFMQDTTDECFQLMEQGEKLEVCDYATHLISCLAEKGRSNCADWQIMKLPFHT